MNNNETQNNTHIYAVMHFETEIALNKGTVPNKWINTYNHFFNNGKEALNYFLKSTMPYEQIEIVSANDEYELQCKMGEMILKYMNVENIDQLF